MSIKVTSPAPKFSAKAVVNDEIKQVKLDDFAGKWILLFFWPLDFTFVCPTEIIAFSDRAAEFENHNCQLLGISVDSHYTHLAWTKTDRKKGGIGKISFPLISDLDKSISSAYGVLLDAGIALRGLFLIDPHGVIRHSTVNDLPVGRSVDEELRVLQAFQFYEQHGEVCPANWTQGKPTINPDPEKSMEYFAKAVS